MKYPVGSHEFYMQLALEEAWNYQLLTYPNPAVGALILNKYGKIIALQAHKEAGKPHAEVLAMQEAYCALCGDDTILKLEKSDDIHAFLEEHHAGLFNECTLYVTLEPCNSHGKTPACSYLIQTVAFQKVVIGALDSTNSGAVALLEDARIEVVTGVCKEASETLIEPFLAWNKGRFVVAKWAQHQNGVMTGGTISDETSRKHMHLLRSKVDTLVIGGNTVRNDRPLLDARLVHKKAPNVLILSNNTNWDKTVPLFNVTDREVNMGSLEALRASKGLVMIELGTTLFESLKDEIDWYMVYQTPHIRFGDTLKAEVNGVYVHTQAVHKDQLHWIKKVTK